MSLYKYTVKSRDGQTIQSTMEAQNEGEVVNELRVRGFMIVEITKAKAPAKSKSYRKIGLEELVIFTRQMATMIDAGLPLLQSLRIMSEQMENINFRAIINQVSDEVEGGSSFSEALTKHPKAFNRLFCAMIRVGETSGMFAEILQKIATYMEEEARLRRKVKSAMVYPMVVSGMAVLIVTFLLIKVIPTFKDIYTGFGAELPAPTLVVLSISHWVQNYILLIVFSCIAIFLLARGYYKTEPGRIFFDRLQFKIPVFGNILKKSALSRFTKTFGTLIASGVPMVQSLEIVESVAGNATIEYALKAVSRKIIAGEGVASPLAEAKVFPPMVIRMIDVGERTGKLDVMLQKISEFYDDQVNNAVNALTSLIEPLLIAFLGVVVGGIVIAMFLPILRLATIVN
jgi:type IV pilus assembly protein PilC